MNVLKRSIIRSGFLFILLVVTEGLLAFAPVQDTTSLIPQNRRNIRYQNADSALTFLQSEHERMLRSNDSLKAIDALLEMADIYGHQAQYVQSYDIFWKSLLLAEKIGNDSLNAAIYLKLGRLYSFYKREGDAFEYLDKALKINKRLVAEQQLNAAELVHNYYAYCNTYREIDQPKLARMYLDSCEMYYKDIPGQVDVASLRFEKSYILAQNGAHAEALAILGDIEPWYLKNLPSYLVLVYTYWGDIFYATDKIDSSKDYYAKALEISDRYQSHIDFTPLIYHKLGDLHLGEKDFAKAFENQRRADQLNARFFDSRSDNNRSLLEIKDAFRSEKERQKELIQQQRLAQLEQEDKISMLERIILLGTVIFLLIIGWLYVKHLRTKHDTEKQLIRRNKELEVRKAEELVELKNKELAASALQMVEKDEFLQMLKRQLKNDKGTFKSTDLKQLLRSISVSNDLSWQEFKLRFTAVNENFYRKLTHDYPKLSQRDQKICALVKLNFSSKDMARLLGISVESVHTNRYRLRKKMGLDRSVNLEDFIAAI